MSAYHEHEPVVEKREYVQEPASSLTAYAMVKYGFILAITIVILWFVATQILDRF